MATVSAAHAHRFAMLASSSDPRLIDQPGTTYDAAAVTSPVINTGLIANTTPNGIAVDLVRNGIVLNTGTIEATGTGGVGVRIVSTAPAGTGAVVLNSGTISGTLDGIDLAAGGFVANSAGGLIQGSSRYGIDVTGGPGTIFNAGTVSGGSGGAAIAMLSAGHLTNSGKVEGGSGVSNQGINYSGGLEGGNGSIGVMLHSGIVANSGTISGGSGGEAITYDTFRYSYGGAGGAGLVLEASGTLSNSGTISGGDGGQVYGYSGFAASGGSGVQVQSGRVTNDGAILGGAGGNGDGENSGFGGNGGSGLVMRSGIVVNNGTIAGGDGGGAGGFYGAIVDGNGAAALVMTSQGTVTNSGVIIGGSVFNTSSGVGIVLGGGGLISNATSGHISGGLSDAIYGQPAIVSADGIDVSGGAGTVVDAGTISGADAINFSGSFADRVILDPGAVLQGRVIGGTGSNTLELAAGGFGSTGTVSAFGSEFQGFGTITLDKGAHWLLDGASPTGQSVTLAGGSHVLSLNDNAGFSDPLSGFGNSDALDLRDVAHAAGAKATLSGSTLTVKSGAVTDTLTLLGLKAGTSFAVGNDGTGHVLINETVSPTAGHTASTSMRFLAGTAAAPAPLHALFLAQASHAAMAESLQRFPGASPAFKAWSGDPAGGLHAAPHAIPASTHLAAIVRSDGPATHFVWLHHNV